MEKAENLSLSEKNNNLGIVDISMETIATIAGIAATECYGVVGMSSRTLHDGIADLLHQENYAKGIEIITEDEEIIINMYVILQYGIRINEVATNIINKVKYTIENHLNIRINQVNIMVQGIHIDLKNQ